MSRDLSGGMVAKPSPLTWDAVLKALKTKAASKGLSVVEVATALKADPNETRHLLRIMWGAGAIERVKLPTRMISFAYKLVK